MGMTKEEFVQRLQAEQRKKKETSAIKEEKLFDDYQTSKIIRLRDRNWKRRRK